MILDERYRPFALEGNRVVLMAARFVLMEGRLVDAHPWVLEESPAAHSLRIRLPWGLEESPAAHSLRIRLPERRMDICIRRLDRACEAWRAHQFHPKQCHPNESRPPPRLRRSAS